MSDLPTTSVDPSPTDLPPIFSRLPGREPSTAQPGSALHRLAGPVTPVAPPAQGTPPAVVDLRQRRHTGARTVAPPAPATYGTAPVATTSMAHQAAGIDWQLVALLRSQASERLTAALGGERGTDREAEREVGRAIIQELLDSETAERLSRGETTWSLDEHAALAQAVFNALFDLGRLQPLVDDDTVEDIIVCGSQNVFLNRADGTLQRVAPVADSDAELTDFIAFIGTRSEANARAFDPANPTLHLRLDGGHRLAAAAWVTARPSLVIRRHRLLRVTLDDLIERGTITPLQATFLAAAVKAGKSIVVAGPQAGGKTTLLRALCAQIPPWQSIGTFETEFELHLHDLPDVHPIVHAWEARPGTGELITPDGRRAGEYTLDDALADSFRFTLARQIVGEVRGSEAWAMIKAMESGAGSLSTTHAESAEAALSKLVSCAMERGTQITSELATNKLARAVNFVVQLHLETRPLGSDRWLRQRWVSEILAVTPGEQVKGYATTSVFRPNPHGGPAIPGILPDQYRALEAHGFDINAYFAESGTIAGGHA